MVRYAHWKNKIMLILSTDLENCLSKDVDNKM